MYTYTAPLIPATRSLSRTRGDAGRAAQSRGAIRYIVLLFYTTVEQTSESIEQPKPDKQIY